MAALVAPGSEISRERSARHVPRHHHLAPYAAVVLRGCYVEAGDRGRFRAEAGAVLFHGRFEAHQDQFGRGGADILNLHLHEAPSAAIARVEDPDAVARLAERDARAAAAHLLANSGEGAGLIDDWPDRLAAQLRADSVASLADWAEEHGLRASSLSRGFRQCYGVSPQRYRLEQRARRAAGAARARRGSLAAVAVASGFADQAHMNRTMRQLFGCTPGRLRD